MSETNKPSRFAILTGSGRGAVGVVWCSGPLATEALRKHFRSARSGVRPRSVGTLTYGLWDYSEVEGLMSEDVIVLTRGNDEYEVHIHGGAQSKEALSSSLVSHGLIEQSPDEWLDSNSKSQLAVVVANGLLRCETEKIARLLLEQTGAWQQLVERMQRCVQRRAGAELANEAAKVLAWREVADHLVQPWKVVLAGRPNVGKSSLINALCGFERAIVHRTPGTTRDVVTQRLVVDGWSMELADTAGQREATSEIEAAGMIRARDVWQEADCRIAVRDASEDGPLEKWEPAPDLVVANKIDLAAGAGTAESLPVSARSGAGIADLQKAIVRRLVPAEPTVETPLPIDSELTRWLGQLVEAGSRGDFGVAVELLGNLDKYCGKRLA